MSTRRNFIAGTTTVATIGLSGCLGYELIPTDEVAARDEQIETKAHTIEDLRTENERLAADLDEIENELADTHDALATASEDIERLEAERTALEAEEFLVRYRYGYRVAASGTDAYRIGVAHWNDRAGLAAFRAFERGHSFFTAAAEAFDQSRTIAGERRLTTAQDHTEDALGYTTEMAATCYHMALSAKWFVAGDPDNLTREFQAASAALDNARTTSIPTPATVEASL